MTHCDHKAEEHKATQRLTFATWVLAAATLALCLVTGMLVYASYEEHEAKTQEHAAEQIQPTKQESE